MSTHTFLQTRKKERILILNILRTSATKQIRGQCITASIVEIHDALLIALAHNAQRAHFLINIRNIDAHKLRKTHPTVEKERDDAVISLFIFGFIVLCHRREQIQTFILCQIFRQYRFLFRRFNICRRIFFDHTLRHYHIFKESANGGKLSRTGGRSVFLRIGNIKEKFQNIKRSDRLHKFYVHTRNGDRRELLSLCGAPFFRSNQILKKQMQIRAVFRNRARGSRLNDELIFQKSFHHRRKILCGAHSFCHHFTSFS